MKMLVLGFDGASPKLMEEWINELPTFRAISEQGVFGETVPPTPAQTPVAWTTFMTGRNPGNHGIFSFVMRGRGTYEREIARPQALACRSLWQIMAAVNRRVGIMNIPMTDAEGVNGFVVPGFLSRTEGVPHPKDLKEKIRRRFNVERIRGDLESETLDNVRTDPDTFFEKVNEVTDEMAEIALYVLQEEKWDFFMPVFMALDRVQHFFWRYVDQSHPTYEENEYSDLVKDCYSKLDGITGRFMRSTDEETIVMIVSDHGFCPIHTEVIMNNYLEEKGLLVSRSGSVDVARSQAVCYGYGDIWLNVRGREPEGVISSGEEYEKIRNQIVECLEEVTVDGKKPIKHVRKREEVWWGRYLDQAADLTAIFNVGYQAARKPEIAVKNELKRYVNDNPRWSGGHDGTHDPDDVPGVIGIVGPAIPAGKDIRVHLWDVAPTILSLMNIPIPADMDGKPLRLQG